MTKVFLNNQSVILICSTGEQKVRGFINDVKGSTCCSVKPLTEQRRGDGGGSRAGGGAESAGVKTPPQHKEASSSWSRSAARI